MLPESVPMSWSSQILESQLLLSLIVTAAFVMVVRWAWRKAADEDTRQAEAERLTRRVLDADLMRRIDDGEYRIPDEKVPLVMRAIFPESPRWAKREERAS